MLKRTTTNHIQSLMRKATAAIATEMAREALTSVLN